jgi:hypothetical protein
MSDPALMLNRARGRDSELDGSTAEDIRNHKSLHFQHVRQTRVRYAHVAVQYFDAVHP